MASITAANAVFLLTVPGVSAGPTQLIGFGVDDAFTADATDITETQTGVDGYGVAGYVPRTVPMAVRFLASSPSVRLFENWAAIMDQVQDVLYASALITIVATGRKYTFPYGSLVRNSNVPDARRVLQNREWRINWLPQGPGNPAVSSSPS